mgnify:CR=1 FL=1
MFKVRIVIQGNFMRNADGRRVTEWVEHDVPMSLPEVRLLRTDGLREDEVVFYQADIVGAYLKAWLKGRPVFARGHKSVQGLFTGARAKRWAETPEGYVKVNKAM